MSDVAQADERTESRVDRVATYIVRFAALLSAVHFGRMWDYAWYWDIAIYTGIYVAVNVAGWALYQVLKKAWTYSLRPNSN